MSAEWGKGDENKWSRIVAREINEENYYLRPNNKVVNVTARVINGALSFNFKTTLRWCFMWKIAVVYNWSRCFSYFYSEPEPEFSRIFKFFQWWSPKYCPSYGALNTALAVTEKAPNFCKFWFWNSFCVYPTESDRFLSSSLPNTEIFQHWHFL